jgi:hypothetical protein
VFPKDLAQHVARRGQLQPPDQPARPTDSRRHRRGAARFARSMATNSFGPPLAVWGCVDAALVVSRPC